jgi:hypothetical protein
VATANIAVNEVISGERAELEAEVHPCIEFNDSGDDNAGEEDIKVATVNFTVNKMISGECAEGAAEVRPRPPSLPAFGSGRVSNTAATAVSSEGERIESNMRMLILSNADATNSTANIDAAADISAADADAYVYSGEARGHQ